MPGKGDKGTPTEGEGAMGGAIGLVHNARQAYQDCSRERATAMDKRIADALVRNATELMAKFTALLNEKITTSMPTALKVTSGAAGISAMPSFDWTRDKTIYQR